MELTWSTSVVGSARVDLLILRLRCSLDDDSVEPWCTCVYGTYGDESVC